MNDITTMTANSDVTPLTAIGILYPNFSPIGPKKAEETAPPIADTKFIMPVLPPILSMLNIFDTP